MAPVRMYIDKFGGEVLIDDDHPLAVAQRARAPVHPTDSVIGAPTPSIAPASGTEPSVNAIAGTVAESQSSPAAPVRRGRRSG